MVNLDRTLPGSHGRFPVTEGKVLSPLPNAHLGVSKRLSARRETQRGHACTPYTPLLTTSTKHFNHQTLINNVKNTVYQ